MNGDNLTRRIPHRTAAGAARPVKRGVNVTGMPVAFVDVEVGYRAEFNGIFFLIVVADEQQFIAEGEFIPRAEFDGLEFKVNFGRVDLIEPKVVGSIVVEDARLGEAAIVKVDFDVGGAAACHMPICRDDAACRVNDEAGCETGAFRLRFKDDFGGGFDVHYHRFKCRDLLCPIVCCVRVGEREEQPHAQSDKSLFEVHCYPFKSVF